MVPLFSRARVELCAATLLRNRQRTRSTRNPPAPQSVVGSALRRRTTPAVDASHDSRAAVEKVISNDALLRAAHARRAQRTTTEAVAPRARAGVAVPVQTTTGTAAAAPEHPDRRPRPQNTFRKRLDQPELYETSDVPVSMSQKVVGWCWNSKPVEGGRR